MKLYRISQTENNGWYTYDSAVVVAENAQQAKRIVPSPQYIYDGGFYYIYNNQEMAKEKSCPSWTNPKNVKAEEIGETVRKAGEVVTASFNAGMDESRYLDLRALKAAYNDPHSAKRTKKIAKRNIEAIEKQIRDSIQAELRYHLIEAHRVDDIKKVLEYELKLRDYLNEEHEDWS